MSDYTCARICRTGVTGQWNPKFQWLEVAGLPSDEMHDVSDEAEPRPNQLDTDTSFALDFGKYLADLFNDNGADDAEPNHSTIDGQAAVHVACVDHGGGSRRTPLWQLRSAQRGGVKEFVVAHWGGNLKDMAAALHLARPTGAKPMQKKTHVPCSYGCQLLRHR